MEKEKIYRIDNLEGLEVLVDCGIETILPEVDFKNNTLVILQFKLPFPGYSLDGAYKINKQLIKKSEAEKYLLLVEAHGKKWDNVETYTTYTVSILTPIELKNASIEYEVKIVESKQ